MGTGGEIGSQLRLWLQRDQAAPLQPRLLEAFLLDQLGGETRLRGPLRDLAVQPLLLQVLREPSAAVRRSLLDTLARDLAEIYAPPVLEELLALLEAATGLAPASAPGAAAEPVGRDSAAPRSAPPAWMAPADAHDRSRALREAGLLLRRQLRALARAIHPLAPGLALGFANALVIAWLGGELGRLLPASWRAGVSLVVVLTAVELLLLRPFQSLRRRAPLSLGDSGDPHRAWRWITAPWVHQRPLEALLNAALLLILLGGTPLPLGPLLLRYLLTALATMAGAVLLARRWLRQGSWDGATGAVAALIALATGVSLLQWRPAQFPCGPLNVPAWVLLLVYGAIQMAWVLPRRERQDPSRPWQRLLCSSWFWGTALGLLWALLSRVPGWVGPITQALLQGLGSRS